jgi:hypothetical protein
MHASHPLIDAFGRPQAIVAPRQIEPSVSFPFHELDGDLADGEEPLSFTPGEWEKFRRALERIFLWIYQDPHHRNLNGVEIRALIVAWFVVKELHPLSLTQLARMYGREKQSFGRWVDEFKTAFPEVRNCHMEE